jgi:hypothetical protein
VPPLRTQLIEFRAILFSCRIVSHGFRCPEIWTTATETIPRNNGRLFEQRTTASTCERDKSVFAINSATRSSSNSVIPRILLSGGRLGIAYPLTQLRALNSRYFSRACCSMLQSFSTQVEANRSRVFPTGRATRLMVP